MAQPPDPPFRLTRHAAEAIARRNIAETWIASTLANPAATEPDRLDPNLTHALAPIPENAGRIPRVVYNPNERPPLVITAFFDRSRKGTL